MSERDVARERLAAMNVDGWRLESAHGCDGTEEGCAATCPVPIQIQVSPDEIIDAVLDAFGVAAPSPAALDRTGASE
jgi:hypothetical protein